jgi:hypothetical protein
MRIVFLEVSIIVTTKRTIFLVFYEVGFVILVVYIGLITITYKSKAYYSYSFEFLRIGISIIIIY